MDRKFINDVVNSASQAILDSGFVGESYGTNEAAMLQSLWQMCHEPAPQASPHIAMSIGTWEQDATRIDAEAFSEPIKTMFDGTGLDTEDELTVGILKISLIDSAAYKTLCTVFLNHKYPQHLDKMGARIRDILLKLNKGENNGESQETREAQEVDQAPAAGSQTD